MTLFDLSAHLFFQLALILAVCRGVGWLANRFGQPRVVGEMVAGMVMGPSLFGLLLPDAHAAVFPAQSMPILFATSQIGLALYMFLMGLEFNTERFRGEWRNALWVSLAGMLAPFVSGSILAALLMDRYDLFGEAVTRSQAMVFLGAAMCITAFPMLARIIHERNLVGTSLGTLVLAAGAINDAAAWGVLAIVLASFGDDLRLAVHAIGGGIAYTFLILTVGRSLLRPLGRLAERTGDVSESLLALTLILVMVGAWITDTIGIYAVFGTFMMGVVMPRGLFAERLLSKLEPFVAVFLLPLFFTYSGLQTRLALVDSPALVLVALAILVGACGGKGVACWLAARVNGEPNREAVAIGALMNARGLMELILLNIGLERGVITPTLFAVMVLMAIVTTLMATPVFEWAAGPRNRLLGCTATSSPAPVR